MKYILTNKTIDSAGLPFTSDKIYEQKKAGVSIYFDSKTNYIEEDDFLAITHGYLFNLRLDTDDFKAREISSLREINNNWPLSKDHTGSFATTIVKEKEILLSNDCIGFYPLFFFIKDNTWVVSNDIYWMTFAIENPEVDEVGLIQKTFGIENATVGRRTILKNVQRLLPGEQLKIDIQNPEIRYSSFDNSLLKIDKSINMDRNSMFSFWEDYKREIQILVANGRKNYLALSGGMDSRILLGALKDGDDMECLTYGHDEHYEVSVARRLAQKKSFEFSNYHDYKIYFPEYSVFEKYVKKNESLHTSSWLEILEKVEEAKDSYIILGDMCEVLPGRNIKAYSSRKNRIKSFFKNYILKKDPIFQPSTGEAFQKWKTLTLEVCLRSYNQKDIQVLIEKLSYEQILEEIARDYEELFERIEGHELAYSELYSELFAWYTHSRIPMGEQVLTCDYKFKAICPPMSLNIIRNSSSIHPKYRIGYRFMNRIFRAVPDLRELNSIPTSQSPLINRNWFSNLVFLMWGVRSKIDHWFIRRLIRNKNPKMRYRLFKSLNWVEIYQQEGCLEKMESYFTGTDERFEMVKEKSINSLKDRISLDEWPYTNFDLLGKGSIAVQIKLIQEVIDKRN